MNRPTPAVRISWSASRTTTRSGTGRAESGLASWSAPSRLRVAALLLLTSPYVPLLFAGEEWAAGTPFLYFSDHEAELGRRVTEGRRREFARFDWDPSEVPDPQALTTFTASVLRWEERDQSAHASMLDWYRELIRLRRSEVDLGCGDPRRSRVWLRLAPSGCWWSGAAI